MSLKLDKRILFVLTVFLMLVIIPTSFADDINDADVVGVDDDSAVDVVSESAVDDVKQSSVDNSSFLSVSEVEKTDASDESDELGYGEDYITTPSPSTVNDYEIGTDKNIVVSVSIDDYCKQEIEDYLDTVYVYIGDSKYEIPGASTTSAFNFNLNTLDSSKLSVGSNTLKFGVNYESLENWGYSTLLNSLTVNVIESGSGTGGTDPIVDPDDDSIWVDGSYTGDTSTGTRDAPFKTIAAAISSSASNGKTIKIAEGSYVLTSAITISKNIALVGVGEVNITRSGGQIFTKSSAVSSISFTGLNFVNSYAGSNSVILHDTCTSGNLGTLEFVNCTFISNTGQSIIRAYDNVKLDGCVFMDNSATATSANGGGGAIVFKPYGSSAKITVTNSIFINNNVKTNVFYDWSNGAKLTTENTFWGTNDKPSISSLFNQGTSSTTFTSWAVIDYSIADDVNVGDNPELSIKFKSTTDGATFTEMASVMPNLTVALTPALGTVTPATVTISNNIATATYGATTEGDENITVKSGTKELAVVSFHVEESPIGKVFVDASYAGGDSDGSKAKPYTSISDALDNLGTNTQVVIKKGTYTLNNYAVNSDVIITGKEDDVIITTTANHMTVASGKTVTLNNLIFKGATTTSIVSNGILSVNDCLFEDNAGTNVISSTEGSVDIAYTVFNNNEVTGAIVDALAGTVDNNFWGSNTPNVAAALTLNKYVIINATIPSMREGNELESEVTHDINIKFILNDGTELDKSLHNVTVTLSSTLGEVTESATIIDNAASAQYLSNVEGDGQIDVKLGNVDLKTFTFTVIERETGRIFVDASYAGDDSDGSKAKPYKTFSEAATKNNQVGGGQEIIVYSGTYVGNNYNSGKDMTVTGRGTVIFDVNNGRFFNLAGSGITAVLNNVIIVNNTASSATFGSSIKDLTLINCTVANGTLGANIVDISGALKVYDSSFINQKCTDGRWGPIKAGTVTINNSIFNNVNYVADYESYGSPTKQYLITGTVLNIDGNFWGTNDLTGLFRSGVTVNNWVVAVPSIAETIVQGQTPVLTVEFKNTTDGETFTALNAVLPDAVLGLTSLLGNAFVPETVTVSNNIGQATYNAVTNGNEVIGVTSGDKTIASIERNIEEGDSPDKIFVDETSTATDADGSKDKPFNNLKDAFDAITDARNTVVVLEGNYAISDYTLNKNATIRWSKKPVTVTAKNLVIAGDVTFSDLIFKDGNAITVNDGAKLTVENTKFVNNTAGITSAGDLTISESQFINTPDTITATAGTVNIEFSEFVLSDAISIASGVTGKINNNYWGDKVPTAIGGAELANWIVLVITPGEDAIDVNASEVLTFDIAFKNTTDGVNFTDLTKEMPALEISIAPAIGSVDVNEITLTDSASVTYSATTEGAETINLTTSGVVFDSLSFNVGKSVAGKIFVSKDGSDTTGDGSRSKPFASLSAAIDAASSGNEIIISEGVYTESSYKTIYSETLNLVVTGVGNVVLTRNPTTSSPYLLNLYYGCTFTFNNLVFANFNGGTSSYGSVIQGPTSSYYGYATININNCTFENNTAGYSPIYVTYGYVNIEGSKFINNVASVTGQRGTVVYVERGSLNIANSVFIDNKCGYTYDIYTYMDSALSVDVNNNFWGSNDNPTTKFNPSYPNSIPTTWVIVNATIDSDKITAGDKPTVKLTFLSTDGENVTELTGALPDVTVSLTSILNGIDSTATISNNVAEITYDAVKDGDEVITINLGDNQLTNLTFTVEEKDDGTKVFVDAAYTGESDGSKDKPFTNLKDAFDSAKETGKKYVSIAQGTYEIANYEIASDVEITGKKVVTVKATDLTVNANVVFNNLIFNDGNAINLNADKNLSIYDSTFTSNAGAIISNGNLLINASKFIDNTAIDGKGIINALAGTINIAYSEFVNCDDGSVIVYSDVAGDVNNNYWANNDEIKVSDIIKPTSWIKLVASISSDDVKQGKEYDVELKFVTNNGTELDVAMPELDVDLTAAIGSVTPVAAMVENKATATYKSDVEGSEIVTVAGNVTSLEFGVTEDETGKLYVAPSDYERDTTQAIGSKANPYDNLASALSAATANTEIVMFEGTYTTSSYYTINKNNLKITGRGKVILTSSSTSQSYFIRNVASGASYVYDLTLTNLIFENITLGGSSSAIIHFKGYYGYSYTTYSYTYEYSDLTLINCTFNNNNAPYGVVYGEQYATLDATGNVFYNNKATYSSGYANIVRVSGNAFTFNYNILIDNKVTSSSAYIVYGPTGTDANYNFWGSNDKPVTYKDYYQVNANKWVVAEITIDNDNLTYSDAATVTVKFRYTADGENFTDLEKSMPAYAFDLSAILGSIPESVTVENNIGQVTYNATAVGEEVIKLNEIANITFNVSKHASSVEIIVDPTHYVGDNFTIVINNDSAVKVTVNGDAYDVVDGKVVIDTTVLAADEYTVVATIDENAQYLNSTANATFTIVKYESHVEIIVDPTHYVGDNFTIVINNDSAVKVTVNGDAYDVVDGKVVIDTTVLAAGEYTVVATIDENAQYLNSTASEKFTLTDSLSVTIEKINEGEKLNVTINDAAKTTGTATVTIENGIYTIDVVDGFGNKVLDTNLKSGTYEVNTVLNNYKNTTSVVVGLRKVDLTFEISEIMAGENATIKVIAPEDIMGNEIVIYLDGTQYTVTKDNNFTLVTDALPADKYSVSAIYLGDKIYGVLVGATSFTVSKHPTSMEVTSAVINAGEVAKINIKLNESISGKVYVDIGNIRQIVNIELGVGELNVSNLKVGTYNVSALFEGDNVFAGCENDAATILVNANDAGLKANASDIKVGENAVINVEINSAATGNVNVKLGNGIYPVAIVNGKGSVTISDLSADTYIAEVTFSGDDLFEASSVNVTFTVSKSEIPSDINVSMDIPEGTTSPEFTINLPADATGNFTVTVDGTNYTEPLVNGSATVKVPELAVGDHNISSSYSGDAKYDGFTSAAQTVNVPKASIPGGEDALNMTTPSDSATPSFSINLPSDAKGNLTVTVDGKDTYTKALENGSATVTVPKLDSGKHDINVAYTGDDKYSGISKNTTVTVPKPVVKLSKNKNIKMLYSAGTKYKVLVTVDGKAKAGVKVTIKFNGKTKKVTTDKKGYATYKIPTVKPKKYTITASYGGKTVKNTVKVNTVIKAKNMNVKKSKKVTKVKITLKKVNKKYLKGKKITIKFKGKKYKVKTNKKGVATWKVKKSMLKKLKVGKKYKYYVTYGKDKATKKLTIKK